MKTHSLSTSLLLISSFLGCWLLGGCNKVAEKTAGFSDRLEASRGLMKIRLGTPISQYPGFIKWELPAGSAPLPEGVATYTYTAKDEKYNTLGPFSVRSFVTEKLLAEALDGRPSTFVAAEYPELFLFVYTLNDTICAVKAQISNVKDGKPQIFNHYLEEVYGPTIGSLTNPDDIIKNIQTDDVVTWESNSVILESKILTVNRYHKGNVLNFDTFNELSYQWKTAYARINRQVENQESKKKATLQDQL